MIQERKVSRLRVALVVKNPPTNAVDIRDAGSFIPWVGKIPWRRAWQPTPVFLPEESHGQRSLVGQSSGGCKESDTTEVTEDIHRELNSRMTQRMDPSKLK